MKPSDGVSPQLCVQVHDVHLRYPNGTRALNGATLDVRRGEIVALIGPNGSGKSTLLRCIAGLLSQDSGELKVEGESLAGRSARERALRVALLPQRVEMVPGISALEFVLMGRYAHLAGWKLYSKQDTHIALGALEQADASEFKDRALDEMSGGERQRVLLARALAQQAPLILLDEPTSALDLKHQILFYRLLRRLRDEEGKTILTATHDLNLASQFADRIALLRNGRIAASGTPAETLQPQILREVYEVEIAHGAFEETVDGTVRPWVLPWAKRI